MLHKGDRDSAVEGRTCASAAPAATACSAQAGDEVSTAAQSEPKRVAASVGRSHRFTATPLLLFRTSAEHGRLPHELLRICFCYLHRASLGLVACFTGHSCRGPCAEWLPNHLGSPSSRFVMICLSHVLNTSEYCLAEPSSRKAAYTFRFLLATSPSAEVAEEC